MMPRSVPAWGSVRSMAPAQTPEYMLGRYFCFSSWLPWASRARQAPAVSIGARPNDMLAPCIISSNWATRVMGMPKTLVAQFEEMMQGANMSFGLAPMLTAGACLALDAHGSQELKQKYLPNMYSGVWAGAMDLTEPHAGTDLGIIRTKAEPNDDGSFNVTGTKIFITWGEHDMAENIIHLVLAKLPGAPKGPKGISLFLVPKFMVNRSEEH